MLTLLALERGITSIILFLIFLLNLNHFNLIIIFSIFCLSVGEASFGIGLLVSINRSLHKEMKSNFLYSCKLNIKHKPSKFLIASKLV